MLRCDAGLASLHAGKLESALHAFRGSVESRSIAPMSSGFAWALGLRLSGLIDAADIDAIDIESAVQTTMQLRESQLVAAVTGAAARALLEHGEIQRARAIVEKALEIVEVPDQAYWLCDVAAELLSDEKAAAGRALLAQVVRDAHNPLGAAFLLLFDARRTRDAAAALSAADAFDRLGWPIEAATAAEAAGDLIRAAAIYERLGAARAVRRIRTGSVQRPEPLGAPELTRREREVVQLAARGYSNKSIAAETAIGERTVETHLAAAYRKLGVRSRAELGAFLI
jgi:DNA-binding NarL/FixJ family response regulator